MATRSIWKHLAIAVGIIVMGRAGLANEPPRPGEVAALKQTGAYAERLEQAKALGNHRIDPDRLAQAIYKAKYQALQQQGLNPDQILAAPPPNWKLMPTRGNVKVFAMLIDFLDYPAYTGNTQGNLQSVIFGDGKVNGVLQNPVPYESLTNFYKRASYNQLDLSTGSALGVYHAPYNRSAVAQTTTGRENLIKEAINYFHGRGVNFAQFDNDGNGQIEYFIVLWTGPDNGWANFWWGYQTGWSDSTFNVDGKTLGKYSWQWEYHSGSQISGPFNPRVVIHETGHGLGLPDYYDYDDTLGPDGGVGGLDQMDSNWGDHNAFSKWVLEWITPTVIGTGGLYVTLNPSGSNPGAVLIMPNATATGSSGEFFIVQNRYRTGNDVTYPSDGMLIWHVDATLNPAGTDWL
jgi:M6 family metalloprotease-like protein